MSCLLRICSIFALMYWINITEGTPLFQGFSVQKGFEVNLKPFNFKPISFFKEKWSPFGSFGVRKGIQKRDLGAITGISGDEMPHPPLVHPAPVFEHFEEAEVNNDRKANLETFRELRPGPDPVKPVSSNLIRIPLTQSNPPTEGLYTSVGRNSPVNNYILERPAHPVLEEMYGELPPRPVGPIPAQPVGFFPVQAPGFIPAKPVNPILAQPAVPKEVVPLITPPPGSPVTIAANIPFSEIPPTEGPLVRGSKLALYLGNVFLQLVSQFFTNARAQISQFRQPPPSSVSK